MILQKFPNKCAIVSVLNAHSKQRNVPLPTHGHLKLRSY